jgi:poly(3-hydroxybutyrate) depolymerase
MFPRRVLRVRLLSLLLVALVCPIAGAADPLPSYNVDLGETSVSGISSGAYMAVQMGIAYSEIVTGVGVFAGGPGLGTSGEARGASLVVPLRRHRLRGSPRIGCACDDPPDATSP